MITAGSRLKNTVAVLSVLFSDSPLVNAVVFDDDSARKRTLEGDSGSVLDPADTFRTNLVAARRTDRHGQGVRLGVVARARERRVVALSRRRNRAGEFDPQFVRIETDRRLVVGALTTRLSGRDRLLGDARDRRSRRIRIGVATGIGSTATARDCHRRCNPTTAEERPSVHISHCDGAYKNPCRTIKRPFDSS